jgi:hypothetical protein
MEVGGISISLEDPILAAPQHPEQLYTLVDLHKGGLQGVSMCPFLSSKTH